VIHRLRWAGVGAVVLLWATVAAGLALTDLRLLDDRPISYLGTNDRTVLLFQVGLVVAAVLLAAFSFFVRAVLNPAPGFLAASLVGLVGQVVAAAVPLSGTGTSPAVHTAGGIVLGLSLPVLMWRFAAGQPPGRWRAVAYRLFWLEVAACVVGVTLSRAGKATLAEIFPAVAFHLWIGVVTSRFRSSELGPDRSEVGSGRTHGASLTGLG